jgi:hypothetical protein
MTAVINGSVQAAVPCCRKKALLRPKNYTQMKTLMMMVAVSCWLPAAAQKWAKEYDFVNDCVCGTSLVKKAGKYGFVNKEGKILVPLIYDEASTMNEGYAPVRKGTIWGFVDSTGKVLVEPQYADAASFREGLAAVKKEGKWGYINYTGKFIIEPRFENARSFCEGLAAVTNAKGFWGYIDHQGQLVIPHSYDFADNFENGEAKVIKRDKTLYIDKLNAIVRQ